MHTHSPPTPTPTDSPAPPRSGVDAVRRSLLPVSVRTCPYCRRLGSAAHIAQCGKQLVVCAACGAEVPAAARGGHEASQCKLPVGPSAGGGARVRRTESPARRFPSKFVPDGKETKEIKDGKDGKDGKGVLRCVRRRPPRHTAVPVGPKLATDARPPRRAPTAAAQRAENAPPARSATPLGLSGARAPKSFAELQAERERLGLSRHSQGRSSASFAQSVRSSEAPPALSQMGRLHIKRVGGESSRNSTDGPNASPGASEDHNAASASHLGEHEEERVQA